MTRMDSKSKFFYETIVVIMIIGITVFAYTISSFALTISPSTLPNATIGAAYSQSLVTTEGTEPYTYAITAGALPAGMTLSSSGILSGTPTVVGTFNFTVTVTDSAAVDGSKGYTLTVYPPTVTISPAFLPTATVGTAYSQSLSASGGTAPYSYAITAGALPAGMTLSSSGTLSGTPTEGGSFSFTVTATDSNTGTGPFTGSSAYALTVTAPTITISPSTVSTATVGTAYSQSLSTSGGTAPYTYAITVGTLPLGMNLSSSGTLSGTPTVVGTFNFTVTATDSSSGTGPFTGSSAYALTVTAPAITISPSAVTTATVGTAYSQSLSASGGTAPYTYAITAGALPAGMNLSSSGILSGTPTVSGTFSFTVTATDSSTGTGPYTSTMIYTMTVSNQIHNHSSGGRSSQTTISNSPVSSKTTIIFTIGSNSMLVNESGYTINATPFIQPGTNRTMVPVRYFSEQLGAKVEWLSASKQVKIVSGNTVIFLTIGSKTALVNGVEKEIDCSSILIDSCTFIPLRFIAEELGATVEWEASNPKQIKITH